MRRGACVELFVRSEGGEAATFGTAAVEPAVYDHPERLTGDRYAERGNNQVRYIGTCARGLQSDRE